MIPIVTDDIAVEKLSIYNQQVLADHPLNSARIRNTTRKYLLQGPVTVVDGASYAGDARIEDLPPGQERLISYGIDQQVLVDPNDTRDDTSLQTAWLVKGVLELKNKEIIRQGYLLDNKSDGEKTAIIEHPRTEGWTLAEPATPDETTDTLYRFRRKLPAHKPVKLMVRLEKVAVQTVILTQMNSDQLEGYLQAEAIPAPVHAALAKVIEMKRAVVETQRQLDARKQQIADVTAEQSRIRENMKTVAASTDYYARLVKKLDEQETTIESTQKQMLDLQKKIDDQRKELETYLAGLTLGS